MCNNFPYQPIPEQYRHEKLMIFNSQSSYNNELITRTFIIAITGIYLTHVVGDIKLKHLITDRQGSNSNFLLNN